MTVEERSVAETWVVVKGDWMDDDETLGPGPGGCLATESGAETVTEEEEASWPAGTGVSVL